MKPTAKLIGTVVALALLVLLVVFGGGAGLLDGTDNTATTETSVSAAPTRATPTRATPTRGQSTPGPTRTSGSPIDPETGLRFVDYAALPVQAQETIVLIERGGPFPYGKDGATFGNRERRLPSRPNGYYREYTVRTPGEGDRGARRIVTGDEDRVFFYTADHYASFARVRR